MELATKPSPLQFFDLSVASAGIGYSSGQYLRWISAFSSNPSSFLNFPFFLTEDATVRSIGLYIFSNSLTEVSNVVVELRLLNLDGSVVKTGQTLKIHQVPKNTRTYADVNFEYPVKKGQCVGLYMTFEGNFSASVGILARIGYTVS